MNEYEYDETTDEAASDTSKTSLVVLTLAGIGALTVGKKAFDKVRNYRIVRKSKLDALKTNHVES